MSKPQNVTEYIRQAPKNSQKKLRELRKCLQSVTPNASENLKWSIPSFSYERILYTYAGFKKHVGFFPTPSVLKKFEKELKDFKTGKGSIQFPLDKPLPIALIKKMAKFRIKELKEKDAKWM